MIDKQDFTESEIKEINIFECVECGEEMMHCDECCEDFEAYSKIFCSEYCHICERCHDGL